MKHLATLCIVLVGCVDAKSTFVPGDTLAVHWQTPGSNPDGGPVTCTDVVSHPCPFELYAPTLATDATTMTWTVAAGFSFFTDTLALDATGALIIPQNGGDGSGLRRATTLASDGAGGFSGDITWTLYTVAGNTTWHLELVGGAQ